MAEEYRQRYGREPSQRTLWAMAQAATLETRKAKSRGRSDRSGQPDRTAGDELDAWEARTTERELDALSGVHEAVRCVCSARGPGRSGRAGRRSARARIIRVAVAVGPALRGGVHPGGSCCGRSTGPCRPWRPGWTRPPWPRSWRTRRWPPVRSWRWARRRTWWTCPRWASRASDGRSHLHPTRGRAVHHGGPAGPGGVAAGRGAPRGRRSWSRRTRRTWPWRARTSAPDQAEVAAGLLAARTAVSVLVAPAGAGKTHAMAAFARAWTAVTGGRVVGVTLVHQRGPGDGHRGPGRGVQRGPGPRPP